MNLQEPGLPALMVNNIRKNLLTLSEEVHEMIHNIDKKQSGILNEFEEIHHLFHNVQVSTATYYLRAFLTPYTNHLEALKTAIWHMAERNHGALIVIQRNDSLDNHLYSGIPLLAKLSYPLLESIFYAGNPLHDGAVLIHEDIIISASNVLPVSELKAGMKKIGTRHRAALGITERTDALALVVSEETGRASFAINGKLYPILSKGL